MIGGEKEVRGDIDQSGSELGPGHLSQSPGTATFLILSSSPPLEQNVEPSTMSQPLPAPPSLDKMQEMLASLDNMPLFMSSLPDAGLESNDALEALQSLVHDGTPDGGYVLFSPVFTRSS